MKWMLDRDVCIDIIRRRLPDVVERLQKHVVGDIGISVVTAAELECGVAASSRPAANAEALEQFVSSLEVASFDRPASAVYGRLRATLEKKGQMIGAMDLLIAAHALSLEVRLVTHNSRDFRRVPGLKIEDWR